MHTLFIEWSRVSNQSINFGDQSPNWVDHREVIKNHVHTVLVLDFLLQILRSFLAQHNPAHDLIQLRLHHLELHHNPNT
uniref:Uncharacterized protein n=1 Tax=Arundo donax TaxID=35708 RepID=A0A0A9EHB1_ARUDO